MKFENIKILAYNPLVKGGYCKERHGKEMEERNLDLFNETAIQDLAKKYQKNWPNYFKLGNS